MTARSRFLMCAVACGLLPLAGATPASAAVPAVESGVWWRNQLDGTALPAPAQVPSGGLWVSSTTAGASAISAVRFRLPITDADPIVKLTVAMATTAADSPLGTHVFVLACAANSGWQPTAAGSPGAWSARPEYDCSQGQIGGDYRAGGTSMTFDLSRMVEPGQVASIVLIPGSAPNPTAVAVPVLPVPVPVTLPATPPVTVPELPPPLPTPPDPTASTIPLTFDITFNPVRAAAIAVDAAPVSPADEIATDAFFGPDASFLGGVVAFVPLPSAVPVGGGTAPAPRTAAVRQPVLPLTASQREAARVLAALVLAALCAWAARLLRGGSEPAGRARLTLYDVPSPPAAVPVARWGQGPRAGTPPPLR